MAKKKVEEPVVEGQVMLIFPEKEKQMLETKGLPKPIQKMAVELDELLTWFKAFKVDSIELSVEGTAKTGTLPGLIISAEGKGGMKIVLKPK